MGRRTMLSLVMKNPPLAVLLFAFLAFPATFAHFVRAQAVSHLPDSPSPDSPSVAEPGQPSSDSSKAAEQIGLMGSGASTEITPDGYLRTGFEEMMFFSGADLEPANAHIHNFDQGHPPIVRYQFDRDGIEYRFTIFAAKIDKSAIVEARRHAKFPFMPGFDIRSNIYEPMVNFIRVEITNAGPKPKRAVFASGVRYADPNAAADPRRNNPQTGEAFSRGWMNLFDDANFYRFNRDLYSFPPGYADRSFTIRKNWNEPNPQYVLGVTHVDAGPTTPVGIVTYARELKPGETWSLDFKMPVIPTADPFAISAIDDASFDAIETQLHAEPASDR
jgi:hypothetical protein